MLELLTRNLTIIGGNIAMSNDSDTVIVHGDLIVNRTSSMMNLNRGFLKYWRGDIWSCILLLYMLMVIVVSS